MKIRRKKGTPVKYNYKKTHKYDLMNYKFIPFNKLCNVEFLTLFTQKKSKSLFNKKRNIIKKNDNLTQNEAFFLKRSKYPWGFMYSADISWRTAKWRFPMRYWQYKMKRLFGFVNKKKSVLKWSNFFNYFNNEKCLVNYNKTYSYNENNYSLVHISLTSNNISIIVTKPNGNIWFWATSGTKKYRNSRKHTLSAIKSVARFIFYRILAKKINFIKITYKGQPTKIRLKSVLQIFQRGIHWRKYEILSLIDTNPIPYNGCKKSKKRR